ncbi:hypothetical protein MKX64_15380 [Paenibacillus sp. FSL M8-0334]|uniref:hypothetical protein n=1 Tax=Paenibacillus sp. FSL M8-0334 TaxID=2921623 RepID=UPI0030F878E4
MNKLIVTYFLVGTEGEQRIKHIDVESDLKGPLSAFQVEVEQILSMVERVPTDEIRVTGIMAIQV